MLRHGKISPDIPNLCRQSLSESKRGVFAFSLCSEEVDKKNVKSLIFRKKNK